MPSKLAIVRSLDTVNETGPIVGLLDRFHELAALAVHPSEGTLVLTFAVTGPVERRVLRDAADAIVQHVTALLSVAHERADVLKVALEPDERMSFLRVRRDLRTLTREELQLLTELLGERFGAALVRSPQDEPLTDDDREAQDELVELALEALRAPASQKSMLGFREDRGVLVYYVKVRKAKKARA